MSAETNRRFASPGAALALLLALGCAGGFEPRPMSEVPFRERAQTQVQGNVRVTTAVPSAKESRALFGTSLYRRGVQPVWLEIENRGSELISFLPVGLDPTYFTPIEAAGVDTEEDDSASRWTMRRYFFERGMPLNVPAGEVRTGFVFSALDEGTKAFNVDIVGEDGNLWRFTFFVPVPGLKVDHQEVDWDGLYAEGEGAEHDAAELAELLDRLPCCTTDKSGEGSGDPLNLVVIGEPEDVYYSFIRAGWDETETMHKGSAWKTAVSFVLGTEYRYSPVSGLYVFGRPQDVAFQKARDNIHERNHLRLWLTPYRHAGSAVWIGQISRDIGVRFTRKTITTHKIDPDVDETREFLLEDLAYSQALAKIGSVTGVGPAPISAPRHNLTGDPYFTDGERVVLWLATHPTEIDEIQLLDWTSPSPSE
jgi:hypothetical protein